MKLFDLEIITPDNVVFKGQISSLMVPAQKGYMGILSGHASFVGSLQSGKILLNAQQGEEAQAARSFAVKDGFIEVISRPYKTTEVTILAENISA